MYAQAHEEHWTQEYGQEECLHEINSCTALQNNSNSNELKWIYRVWHEKSKNSGLKIKKPKNLKTQLFRFFRFF